MLRKDLGASFESFGLFPSVYWCLQNGMIILSIKWNVKSDAQTWR